MTPGFETRHNLYHFLLTSEILVERLGSQGIRSNFLKLCTTWYNLGLCLLLYADILDLGQFPHST